MTGDKAEAIRKARLTAALRENLKRRKAQARGREEASERPAQRPGPAGGGPVDETGD
jgi:hypothetical protein